LTTPWVQRWIERIERARVERAEERSVTESLLRDALVELERELGARKEDLERVGEWVGRDPVALLEGGPAFLRILNHGRALLVDGDGAAQPADEQAAILARWLYVVGGSVTDALRQLTFDDLLRRILASAEDRVRRGDL
jgi:hypothetical protein